MTPRERMLAVFKGLKVDRILWQPRLHHWYDVNKKLGTLPSRYRNASIIEIYDDLRATPRSYHFFNPCIRTLQGGKVEVETWEDEMTIRRKYRTPKGVLRESIRKTEYGTATYHIEYPVKSIEDLRVLAYIVEGQEFEFDKEAYLRAMEEVGERAESIVGVPHLPIMRLIVSYMGFGATVKALWKHPREVEDFLSLLDASDDRRFKVIKESPIRIVNFGDNIHHDLVSPPWFRKYVLPYYQRRTKELHEAGKFCTSHWDGNVGKVLPFVRQTGLDGIECLTPKPQGDVTLEEIKEALGDKILIDGLPATHFLPSVSREELRTFVEKVLKMFYPHLILGISDMLPPGGDIEKVRFVSELVEAFEPP
ncbi:MAG: uroporphyrinogen decarboxylase family protein [Candidatus Bathyarchaeia archaeon]